MKFKLTFQTLSDVQWVTFYLNSQRATDNQNAITPKTHVFSLSLRHGSLPHGNYNHTGLIIRSLFIHRERGQFGENALFSVFDPGSWKLSFLLSVTFLAHI